VGRPAAAVRLPGQEGGRQGGPAEAAAPCSDPSLRTVTVRDVPPEQRQPQASPPLLVYHPDVEQVLARPDQILWEVRAWNGHAG